MSRDPLRVLVVDDDYRVASVHVGFVGKVAGFEVVGEAHTAAETLALNDSLSPDVVLLDIYLPDGDGLAVAKELASRPSPPAILIISAANDAENVRAALRLGVTHYLVKPFAFGALEDRLVAIRSLSARLESLPPEATQADVNVLFESLRLSAAPPPADRHLAPTLDLIYRAVTESESGLSASEVAQKIGVSRATAQRALSQLELSHAIRLELKYGNTGRPEHRYRAAIAGRRPTEP